MSPLDSPLSQLVARLSSIEDFRIERSKPYPLNEILFLCVSAVISGIENWEEIADFREVKIDWLRKYLPFINGIPSHDTLNRVISMLDYRVFEQCFIEWSSMGLNLSNGTVINLDGKKIRGSATKQQQQRAHKDGGQSAKHIVHAWCGALERCLGQYQVSSKSNEIVAIPAILELLEIEGYIITIDAMGCQKKIVEQIVSRNADYLISVKDNQATLASAISQSFQDQNRQEQDLEKYQQQERNHGRIESRTCQVLPSCLLANYELY